MLFTFLNHLKIFSNKFLLHPEYSEYCEYSSDRNGAKTLSSKEGNVLNLLRAESVNNKDL